MKENPNSRTILLVDDDPQDRMLIHDAFRDKQLRHRVTDLESAEQLQTYLNGVMEGEDETTSTEPALILLDLNLPRKDGRAVLRELKQHPRFKKIPVVILTTSRSPDDVELCYHSGASSFITKPRSYGELLELVDCLKTYWFQTVELPV